MEASDEPKAVMVPKSVTINDDPPVTVSFAREEDRLYIHIEGKDDSSQLAISVCVPWPTVQAQAQVRDSQAPFSDPVIVAKDEIEANGHADHRDH
jgi:hypothetical protein